jgi:hypothetical protein
MYALHFIIIHYLSRLFYEWKEKVIPPKKTAKVIDRVLKDWQEVLFV